MISWRRGKKLTFRKWNQIQSLLHYHYVFPFNHERNTVQLKQERLSALRYTLSHPVFEQRGCVDGVMYRCYYRPQRSCGKVMFLHRSVILFTGGGVCPSACWNTTLLGRHRPWADTPPVQCMLGYTPPLPSTCWDTHGYCCGWYASYWNAFLCMLWNFSLNPKFCSHLGTYCLEIR